MVTNTNVNTLITILIYTSGALVSERRTYAPECDVIICMTSHLLVCKDTHISTHKRVKHYRYTLLVCLL